MKFIFPSFHFSIERWKWNEQYQLWVSNKGSVKDVNKKFVKPSVNKDGYLAVKGLKYVSIHRLVLLTWKPIDNYREMTVDHLDHNKRNNSVENLEWVSLETNYSRAKEDFLSIELEEDVVKDNLSQIPTMIFNDIGQAAIKCIQLFFIQKDANFNTVKKNILKAATQGTYYCKQRWYILENGKVKLELCKM